MDALVIGAGQISIGYDVDESQNQCRSLVKGLYMNDILDVTIYDPYQQPKVNLPLNYTYIDNLHDFVCKSDTIGIIASPDEYHYEHSREMINMGVKVIMIEKPICTSAKQANHLLNLVKTNGSIKVYVNYFRRFLPSIVTLKLRLLQGDFGDLLLVKGHYGKGLLHSGSHLIDILLYLFDDISCSHVNYVANDYFEHDPSVAFFGYVHYSFRVSELTLAPLSVDVIPSDAYTAFELSMYFEKYVVHIKDFGNNLVIEKAVKSDVLKGYTVLVHDTQVSTEYMQSAFYSINTVKNLGPSNIEDAVKVIEICEKIKEQV